MLNEKVRQTTEKKEDGKNFGRNSYFIKLIFAKLPKN